MDRIEKDGSHSRLAEHSPQLPQGFTPISNLTFLPGQVLEATCDFDSTERTEVTHAGATHHNEMCNLYMMMWSELPIFMTCGGGGAWQDSPGVDRHGPGVAPPLMSMKEALIMALLRCRHRMCYCKCARKHGGKASQRRWCEVVMRPMGVGAGGLPAAGHLVQEAEQHWKPPPPYRADVGGTEHLGQVAGVAKGPEGTVWVLHRGGRVWDADSFEAPDFERITYKDPIGEDVVVRLDQDTGAPAWAHLHFVPALCCP